MIVNGATLSENDKTTTAKMSAATDRTTVRLIN